VLREQGGRNVARRKSLTTREVASYFSVTPAAVAKWIRADLIRAYRTPGGHYRVDVEEFDRFLREHSMPQWGDSGRSSSSRRVLIADDEVTMVMAISEALKAEIEGVEIETAQDGYEACLKAGAFRPQVIVLDLLMPNMNGFEACQALRRAESARSAKVIAITGYPEDGNLERIVECGADCCLVKPFDIDELVEKVKRFLHEQPGDEIRSS